MSQPYCTSLPDPPVLGTDGVLRWSNGGWRCDSGGITNYISHVYTDTGLDLCGAVPAFRYDGTRPLDAVLVPGLDRWWVPGSGSASGIAVLGQWAQLDLYAVTHSVYSGFYDWWEVGNHMAADPTQTARVRFQIPASVPVPPVNPPNVVAAQTWLVEAVNSLAQIQRTLAATYAWSRPTAASYQGVREAGADAITATTQIGKAQAFLRGESP